MGKEKEEKNEEEELEEQEKNSCDQPHSLKKKNGLSSISQTSVHDMKQANFHLNINRTEGCIWHETNQLSLKYKSN